MLKTNIAGKYKRLYFRRKNMKYLYTYKKILEDSIIKAQEMDKGKTNMDYEWMLITEALKNPDEDPKSYQIKIKEQYDIEMDVQDIRKMLRGINLNSPKKRKEMAQIAAESTEILKNMLEGDKSSILRIGGFLDQGIVRTEDGRIKFRYKCLLTYMFNIDNVLKDTKYNTVLTVFKEVYCGNILKKLYRNISRKEGYYKKEDVSEVTARIQKTIDSAPLSVVNMEITENKDKLIEKLKFEISNYQNTIDILQSMLDDLKESIDDAGKEAEKNAVSSFFTKLNSPQYGGILDNLLIVENKMREVKKINTLLPNQLMALPIILKQLLRFVKDIGITPIDTIGRSFEASYIEIDCVNYNGQPFLDDDEVKMMEVQKCGWKYDDIVISIPTVKEKIDI